MAARALTLDAVAARTGVDPKTVQRWIAGRIPHARHRWAIAALVREDETYLWPAIASRRREADPFAQVVGSDLAGVTAAYASRSRFLGDYSPERLFSAATTISMAGLSNNLLCQQFSDQRLEQLLCSGTSVSCLFLDPAGHGTATREVEEQYAAGHLAGLTSLNISLLQRLRARLPETVQDRLWLGTYDETIRFNIVIVERSDDTVAIVQPYLPHARGVDSPTFVLRPSAEPGLLETFTQVLAELKLKATPC